MEPAFPPISYYKVGLGQAPAPFPEAPPSNGIPSPNPKRTSSGRTRTRMETMPTSVDSSGAFDNLPPGLSASQPNSHGLGPLGPPSDFLPPPEHFAQPDAAAHSGDVQGQQAYLHQLLLQISIKQQTHSRLNESMESWSSGSTSWNPHDTNGTPSSGTPAAPDNASPSPGRWASPAQPRLSGRRSMLSTDSNSHQTPARGGESLQPLSSFSPRTGTHFLAASTTPGFSHQRPDVLPPDRSGGRCDSLHHTGTSGGQRLEALLPSASLPSGFRRHSALCNEDSIAQHHWQKQGQLDPIAQNNRMVGSPVQETPSPKPSSYLDELEQRHAVSSPTQPGQEGYMCPKGVASPRTIRVRSAPMSSSRRASRDSTTQGTTPPGAAPLSPVLSIRASPIGFSRAHAGGGEIPRPASGSHPRPSPVSLPVGHRMCSLVIAELSVPSPTLARSPSSSAFDSPRNWDTPLVPRAKRTTSANSTSGVPVAPPSTPITTVPGPGHSPSPSVLAPARSPSPSAPAPAPASEASAPSATATVSSFTAFSRQGSGVEGEEMSEYLPLSATMSPSVPRPSLSAKSATAQLQRQGSATTSSGPLPSRLAHVASMCTPPCSPSNLRSAKSSTGTSDRTITSARAVGSNNTSPPLSLGLSPRNSGSLSGSASPFPSHVPINRQNLLLMSAVASGGGSAPSPKSPLPPTPGRRPPSPFSRNASYSRDSTSDLQLRSESDPAMSRPSVKLRESQRFRQMSTATPVSLHASGSDYSPPAGLSAPVKGGAADNGGGASPTPSNPCTPNANPPGTDSPWKASAFASLAARLEPVSVEPKPVSKTVLEQYLDLESATYDLDATPDENDLDLDLLPPQGEAPLEPPLELAQDLSLLKPLDAIGAGSFGAVRKFLHPKFGEVAVKMLLPSANHEDKDALLTEVDLLCRLEHHPNIVKVLSANIEGDNPFMLQELVRGGSLDAAIHGSDLTPRGAVEEEMASSANDRLQQVAGAMERLAPSNMGWGLPRVLEVAADVLEALCYLHVDAPRQIPGLGGQPVVHRDLKPANILVEAHTGRVKVCDFGLSRQQSGSRVQTKDVAAGTIAYVAPELLAQQGTARLSTECDMYSYGVLLWEMVTTARPWHGLNTMQILYQVGISNGRLEIPRHGHPLCPEPLRELLRRCFSDENRPTAPEALAAIDMMRLQVGQSKHHRKASTAGPSFSQTLGIRSLIARLSNLPISQLVSFDLCLSQNAAAASLPIIAAAITELLREVHGEAGRPSASSNHASSMQSTLLVGQSSGNVVVIAVMEDMAGGLAHQQTTSADKWVTALEILYPLGLGQALTLQVDEYMSVVLPPLPGMKKLPEVSNGSCLAAVDRSCSLGGMGAPRCSTPKLGRPGSARLLSEGAGQKLGLPLPLTTQVRMLQPRRLVEGSWTSSTSARGVVTGEVHSSIVSKPVSAPAVASGQVDTGTGSASGTAAGGPTGTAAGGSATGTASGQVDAGTGSASGTAAGGAPSTVGTDETATTSISFPTSDASTSNGHRPTSAAPPQGQHSASSSGLEISGVYLVNGDHGLELRVTLLPPRLAQQLPRSCPPTEGGQGTATPDVSSSGDGAWPTMASGNISQVILFCVWEPATMNASSLDGLEVHPSSWTILPADPNGGSIIVIRDIPGPLFYAPFPLAMVVYGRWGQHGPPYGLTVSHPARRRVVTPL